MSDRQVLIYTRGDDTSRLAQQETCELYLHTIGLQPTGYFRDHDAPTTRFRPGLTKLLQAIDDAPWRGHLVIVARPDVIDLNPSRWDEAMAAIYRHAEVYFATCAGTGLHEVYGKHFREVLKALGAFGRFEEKRAHVAVNAFLS